MSYIPVSHLNDLYPTTCPHLLAVRAEYATWNWYTEKGYIRYSRGSRERTDYEHQMVAERAYGPVPQGYHVHHVDGNIKHNAAFNLRVLLAAKHTQLHKTLPKIGLTCPCCGKVYEVAPSQARRRIYCSRLCLHADRYGNKRPSRQRLASLMDQIGNWSALGRMFSVSDNSVRKWAKSYGLDPSVCNGRIRRGLTA